MSSDFFERVYDDETGELKKIIKLGGAPGNGNGDPQPPSGVIQREGLLGLIWKRAGSSDHPDLAAQRLLSARYRQTGDPKVGFDTTIAFTIEINSPSGLGSGPNGKGWYFQPQQDFLKPDFDNGSAEEPGEFQLWINDDSIDRVGGSKWSRNVGSGIDGILLTIDQGLQPVSENYPRTWPAGSKIRVKINYWVPAAT